MAPKKKGAVEEKLPPIIGRMGTNLKVGIVGLPNVGKSTFFNVITKQAIPAENFPFCTIEPNESRVAVPDDRWDWLCAQYKPASKVPAWLNIVDIAGLVKGASEGQGLGNAFLSNISACDAIFHMSRAFAGDEVTHVEGDVDPVRDLEIIYDELRLKDIQHMQPVVEKAAKQLRANDKAKKDELDVLKRILALLEEEKKHVRFRAWNEKEVEVLNQHLLLTAKPIVYLVNLSEDDYVRKKNKWLPKIKAFIDQHDPGAVLIPFSGALESDLADAADAEARAAILAEKQTTSALDKIIKTGYKALQLEYFFTVGPDEVKAWTIQRGTKAPAAAGRIHTDFEKGFIMAEVMKFEDLKAEGSEAAVKAAGKYRQQGKTYVVDDGDIILFKFNAGAGLTGGKKK